MNTKKRFEKGDLVRIKRPYLTNALHIGLIIDVILRSPANEDWDQFLIMWRGKIIERTARQIY